MTVRRPDQIGYSSATFNTCVTAGQVALGVEVIAEDLNNPPDRCYVALPDVLHLLEAIAAKDLTAQDAHDQLVAFAATIEPIGCCMNCLNNLHRYEQNWEDYRKAAAEFAAEPRTPESHPYGITRSGGVHTWNCPMVPPSFEPPGTLPHFTHGGLGYQFNGAWPTTTDELRDWLADRAPSSWRRCKHCQPALPGAFTSEAADVG